MHYYVIDYWKLAAFAFPLMVVALNHLLGPVFLLAYIAGPRLGRVERQVVYYALATLVFIVEALLIQAGWF